MGWQPRQPEQEPMQKRKDDLTPQERAIIALDELTEAVKVFNNSLDTTQEKFREFVTAVSKIKFDKGGFINRDYFLNCANKI